jgi:NADPH:quinone reductase-like Zn-dependent oxidoreductase
VKIVDYKHERFETVGQVDAVLDLIGGETATRSFAVVKKGGVLVSTVGGANTELAARAGIRGLNMVQERSAADLSELASLVERGDVRWARCFGWTRRVRHKTRASKGGPRAKSC